MKTSSLQSGAVFSRSRFVKHSVAGLLALGLCTASHAALLVYDGFGVGPGGYTDGSGLNGNGHGIGWSDAAWTAGSEYDTVSGSIAPGSISSENGMVTFGNGGSSSQGFGRVYSSTFGGATPSQSEAWASFAFERNNTRDFRVNPFSNNTSASAGQYMGIYAANGSNNLTATIRWGSSSEIEFGTSFSLTTGTEYFVVAQAIFNDSGIDDTFNVWMFESSSFDGTLPMSPSMTVSYDFDNTFNAWAADNQNPQGLVDAVVYDEFRIGDTFSDVAAIPEPAAFTVVLGVGVIGLALMRRRRAYRGE